MPLIEYKCDTCPRTFVRLQSINDEFDSHCAVCNNAVYRPITQSTSLFKGNGWIDADACKLGNEAPGDL